MRWYLLAAPYLLGIWGVVAVALLDRPRNVDELAFLWAEGLLWLFVVGAILSIIDDRLRAVKGSAAKQPLRATAVGGFRLTALSGLIWLPMLPYVTWFRGLDEGLFCLWPLFLAVVSTAGWLGLNKNYQMRSSGKLYLPSSLIGILGLFVVVLPPAVLGAVLVVEMDVPLFPLLWFACGLLFSVVSALWAMRFFSGQAGGALSRGLWLGGAVAATWFGCGVLLATGGSVDMRWLMWICGFPTWWVAVGLMMFGWTTPKWLRRAEIAATP